jgi:hypothetical protein
VGMQRQCIAISGIHALTWAMSSLGIEDQVGRIQRCLGGLHLEVNGL